MNKGVIIGIVVVVLVVAGGVFALTKKSDDKTDTSTTPTTANNSTESQSTTPSDNATSNASDSDQNSSTTITYSDSGFSPATLTVKAGTTVTVKNDSSSSLQFSSDPHPVHTDNPELNMGVLAPGKSDTFTVTKTGTWGYHNHLNPSDTGTIVVQ
jgi:plastocyanin